MSNVAWQACLRKPTLTTGGRGRCLFHSSFFRGRLGVKMFFEVSVVPEDYVHMGAVPLRAFVSQLAAM